MEPHKPLNQDNADQAAPDPTPSNSANPNPSNADLLQRIDDLEAQVQEQHKKLRKKVETTNAGGGGIGCLGFLLFGFVIYKLATVEDLLRQLLAG